MKLLRQIHNQSPQTKLKQYKRKVNEFLNGKNKHIKYGRPTEKHQQQKNTRNNTEKENTMFAKFGHSDRFCSDV